MRWNSSLNAELPMADASLNRQQTVRLGAGVAFAQIGIIGFDEQIELEAFRLYALPGEAPALLCGTPALPVGPREFQAEVSWDLPSLAPGVTSLLDVTKANCRVGDLADAALASSTRFTETDAAAWATNTVRGMVRNISPRATYDLGPVTLSVGITKRRIIPPRLNPDLFGVVVAGQRLEPLGGEPSPGLAERVGDCLVAVEQAMAEVAFAQVEPDALDQVEVRRVGRQPHQRHAVRHAQALRGAPAGTVEHEHGVFVLGQGLGEALEEHAHRRGRDMRRDEREVLPGRRTHDGEQMRPGAALIAEAGRPLPAHEPAVADAPLLAEAVGRIRPTVLEPERQAAVRMRGTRPGHGRRQQEPGLPALRRDR